MLLRFHTVFPRAAEDVLRVGSILRHLTTSSGDLPFSTLNQLQEALRAAKLSTLEALEEGSKSPQAAGEFMAAMGGPVSVEAYQMAASDIEVAASVWNARLELALQAMTNEELVRLIARDAETNYATRHVEFAQYMPAYIADPLRGSEELAALLASFQAVGG